MSMREALETCVTALEALADEATLFPATISAALIEARAALDTTQPSVSAEPVAWGLLDPVTGMLHTELVGSKADCEYWTREDSGLHDWTISPIWTSPPPASAPYVPLTDDEILSALRDDVSAAVSMLYALRSDIKVIEMQDGMIQLSRVIERLVVERMRGEKKIMPASLSPSEAVYAFAGWLTCRDESVTMGAAHNAVIAADLVDAFCTSQNLEPPRQGWADAINPYPSAG